MVNDLSSSEFGSGDDVNMDVRYDLSRLFPVVDPYITAGGILGTLNRVNEFLHCLEEGFPVLIREVFESGFMGLGDYEGVSGSNWADIEEGEGFLALVDLVAGQFTSYDFTEDTVGLTHRDAPP